MHAVNRMFMNKLKWLDKSSVHGQLLYLNERLNWLSLVCLSFTIGEFVHGTRICDN